MGTATTSFYGYDGHGNVRLLTNSAGAITDSYTYDAFGAQITSTGTTPNPYLYSGERFDSNLNLYHLRARYYNMLTGRFETIDSYSGNIFDPGTLHKYVFAGNNPVNASDPTGRDVVIEVAFLYARNNFGVLAAARVKFDPWELGETLLTGKEQYENFGFARAIGECDTGLLGTAASALGGLVGGPSLDSKTASNASSKFLACLYSAEKELLQPFPGVNFPPLPEPPEY